jgi:hypothetical protein
MSVSQQHPIKKGEYIYVFEILDCSVGSAVQVLLHCPQIHRFLKIKKQDIKNCGGLM